MKNFFISCFLILAFSSYSFAELIYVPLDELIKHSDLIVVGTLTSISERKIDFSTQGTGEIVVEKVIAGDTVTTKGFSIKSGDELELKYIEGFACVMGSHKRIENEKGIFFLTFDEKGEIKSQTFRSLNDLPEIKSLLKKGISPKKSLKTVKLQEDAPKVSKSESTFRIYEVQQSEGKLFSPALAFLVASASILLYWILYRSKFKIR